MKQWTIIGLIALVLVIGFYMNKNKANKTEETDNTTPSEEVLVQDDGSLVKKVGETIQVMTPEEAKAKKEELDKKLSDNNSESVTLLKEDKNPAGGSQRVFVDGEYIQKISLNGLDALDKGYFYQAWLKNDAEETLSLGRVEVSGDTGTVYYSAKDDKSSYKQILITKEMDDNNPEMGQVVISSSVE